MTDCGCNLFLTFLYAANGILWGLVLARWAEKLWHKLLNP